MTVTVFALICLIVISFGLNIYLYISNRKEHFEKVYIDPLTRIYNRKFIEDEIKDLIKLGKNYDVVYCDIDHFKKINDTYGHDIGDIALQETSRILLDSFKDNDTNKDFIVRMGGEEFVIFLERNDTSYCSVIMDRVEELREAIQNNIIKTESGDINFTMSFGICFDPDNKYTIEEQMKKADDALYSSKNNGRNQITKVN